MSNIATIGHNNPPSDEELLQTKLATNYGDRVKKIEELEAYSVPETITDDNAGVVADFLDKAKKAKKGIEDAHKNEKDAFLKLGRVVDAFKNGNLERIKKAAEPAEKRQHAYLLEKAEAERERIRAIEEAERLKALELAEQAAIHEAEGIKDTASELMGYAIEQEQKADRLGNYADNSKDSKLARVISNTGAVSGLRTAWAGDIIDLAAIDLEKLRHYFKGDHIQLAINAFVKDGGRELSGVKIHQKSTLR